MDICVIVPTYNEADNLEQLVLEILALGSDGRTLDSPDICVLNVDDNSPDGTGELAERLATRHPGRVQTIHRSGKLGLGTAYRAGFELSMELGAQRIITMDADFSHHPRFIPAMIDRSLEADLVIGSRYVDGGGVLGSPLYRRALSRSANLAARSMVGLAALDATAGFRLYRREVIESIDFARIFSSGYSFLIELLYLVQEVGWRVSEVPILFEDRRAGASKISRLEIMRAFYTVWRLGWRRWRK